MDTTSQAIFELCKNIGTYPHCFYGSFSRMSLEMTMDFTLRVSIAPILEEMKGKMNGQIAAGTKMYDDNKKAVFTLTHDEVSKIIRYWKEIRTNTFTSPDPKCKPDFKNKFTVVHFNKQNNTASNFGLVAKDGDTTKLTVSIKGQDGNFSSFQLKNDDAYGVYSLTQFESFLQIHSKSSIYDKLKFQSIIKKMNSALYNMSQQNNNSNNNSNNNNSNNNNRNSNYNNNQNNNRNNNYNNNKPQQNNAPAAQQAAPAAQVVDYTNDDPMINIGSDEFENMLEDSFNNMSL
jgi:hypothetical protein